MNFTPGTKVHVNYATGIMKSSTEVLTISRYENNLLYFKEKSDYYAVECYKASFYGYSHTDAGRVLVTDHKWQLSFASLAESLKMSKISVPTSFEPISRPAAPMQLSGI